MGTWLHLYASWRVYSLRQELSELALACIAVGALPNVRFLDLQPNDRLNDLLGLADIHLLPQRSGAADLVMPSKLTGMLASGRAILATASPETQLSYALEGCGSVRVTRNDG